MIFALLACDDTQFPAPPGGSAPAGSDYDAIQAVFEADCNSCHSAAAALGGLDLETDACASLVGVTAVNYNATLVVAGDHAASVLWHKMSDSGTWGGVMPQTGALPSEYVDGIATWIDEGASCEGGDTGGGDDTGPAPEGYTFQRVQTEVFDVYCAFCHTAAGEGGSWPPLVAGESYAAVVGVAAYGSATPQSLVTAGDPESSFLWRKVRGTIDESLEGDTMPPASPMMGADELTLVYGWILEGAAE